MIRIKNAYEPYDTGDGYRILVDRDWPPGLINDDAGIDFWIQDIAPSPKLRDWFGNDPNKWEEFKGKYFAELTNKRELVEIITNRIPNGLVTLLYASKQPKYNHAEALKEFIYAHFNL